MIDSIIQEGSSISIYIRKDDEIVKWKEFSSTMPVSIEFKIDF